MQAPIQHSEDLIRHQELVFAVLQLQTKFKQHREHRRSNAMTSGTSMALLNSIRRRPRMRSDTEMCIRQS